MLTRPSPPEVFDSSKAAKGEATAMPAAMVAAQLPAAAVNEPGAKSKLGMPLQGGQPCDKQSTNLGGWSTPPSESTILQIITVAQSQSTTVPGLQ